MFSTDLYMFSQKDDMFFQKEDMFSEKVDMFSTDLYMFSQHLDINVKWRRVMGGMMLLFIDFLMDNGGTMVEYVALVHN